MLRVYDVNLIKLVVQNAIGTDKEDIIVNTLALLHFLAKSPLFQLLEFDLVPLISSLLMNHTVSIQVSAIQLIQQLIRVSSVVTRYVSSSDLVEYLFETLTGDSCTLASAILNFLEEYSKNDVYYAAFEAYGFDSLLRVVESLSDHKEMLIHVYRIIHADVQGIQRVEKHTFAKMIDVVSIVLSKKIELPLLLDCLIKILPKVTSPNVVSIQNLLQLILPSLCQTSSTERRDECISFLKNCTLMSIDVLNEHSVSALLAIYVI